MNTLLDLLEFNRERASRQALQPGGKRTLWTTQLDVDIPLGR